MTAAVVLAGAAVRVGGRTILGPLDLSIGTGEQWVLLGPNGSGKTTALTLMGAWRQPSAGTVDVLANDSAGRMCAHFGGGSGTCRTDWRNDSGPTPVLETSCTGREATLVTWWQTFDDASGEARAAGDRRLLGVGRPAARVVLARANASGC